MSISNLGGKHMSFHAYAADSAGKNLEPFEYEPEPLGPSDVEVAVTHCGICHTDLHLLNNDWGFTAFPFVPGHEVVGTVVAKGHNVHHLREGQRVGIGYQSGSCGHCEYCSHDMENLCLGMLGTCVNGYGGYSDGLRVHSRFAVPLPEKLSPESAAPLMCGGITVFTPFRVFDVRPGMGVGVIGIGGLGHLALQFASTLGFEVTAFS